MKIIFIGTGKFGAQILEKLANSQFKPDFLICPPDKPVGRKQMLTPCAAKLAAQKYNLEIAEMNGLKSKAEFFQNLKPDIVIAADTNFILPKQILEIPPYGCLNVHPSILPKYRGPAPIQATILNGDEETGVTIIKMDEKIDHGPIIKKKKLKIKNKKFTFESLRDALADLGAELLTDTIPQWIKGQIAPIKQDDKKASYTKILKRQDGLINWQRSAIQIERQIRAFNPWPGTFSFFEHKGTKKRLKVIEAKAIKWQQQSNQAGKMAIVCAQDALILEKVQPEGKKIMSGKAFLNGYREVSQLIN